MTWLPYEAFHVGSLLLEQRIAWQLPASGSSVWERILGARGLGVFRQRCSVGVTLLVVHAHLALKHSFIPPSNH